MMPCLLVEQARHDDGHSRAGTGPCSVGSSRISRLTSSSALKPLAEGNAARDSLAATPGWPPRAICRGVPSSSRWSSVPSVGPSSPAAVLARRICASSRSRCLSSPSYKASTAPVGSSSESCLRPGDLQCPGKSVLEALQGRLSLPLLWRAVSACPLSAFPLLPDTSRQTQSPCFKPEHSISSRRVAKTAVKKKHADSQGPAGLLSSKCFCTLQSVSAFL